MPLAATWWHGRAHASCAHLGELEHLANERHVRPPAGDRNEANEANEATGDRTAPFAVVPELAGRSSRPGSAAIP